MSSIQYYFKQKKSNQASIVGGIASKGFTQVMGNYIGKKQENILRDIVSGLSTLEERMESFETKNLEDNEDFTTTVLQVLPISLRTKQKEKQAALKNIVLNTALGNTPDEDIHQIFLHHIDTLTSWHLKILTYFDDPRTWFTKNEITIPDTSASASLGLEMVFPELQDRNVFYNEIVNNLISRNLMIDGDYMTRYLSQEEVIERRTTDLGRKFLKFIEDPISKL